MNSVWFLYLVSYLVSDGLLLKNPVHCGVLIGKRERVELTDYVGFAVVKSAIKTTYVQD